MEISKNNEEDLAELVGIFLGDGCLQKDYICVWGNIHNEQEHYNQNIVPLFENFFNITLKPHSKPSNGVYGFYLCNREVLNFWKNTLKFEPGHKTYNLQMPDFILNTNNKNVLKRFIRGFYDCDGCLSFQRKNCKGYSKFKQKFNFYPRAKITSASIGLITNLSDMLEQLGIHFTICKHKGDYKSKGLTFDIVIRGTFNVENFFNQIKPSNFVHTSKYQIWKKYGFVPPNTSLDERHKILKGDIDILYYY